MPIINKTRLYCIHLNTVEGKKTYFLYKYTDNYYF